jgi:hypothetical protein
MKKEDDDSEKSNDDDPWSNIRICSNDEEKYSDKYVRKLFKLEYSDQEVVRGYPECTKGLKRAEEYKDNDLEFMYGTVYHNMETYTSREYCFEKSNNGWMLIVCGDNKLIVYVFHVILMLISITLLSLIVFVHAYFDKLRDVHGKIIISFMSSYILIYISLPLIHLITKFKRYSVVEFFGLPMYIFGIWFSSLWIIVMIFNDFLRIKNFKKSETGYFEYKTYVKGVAIISAFPAIFFLIKMISEFLRAFRHIFRSALFETLMDFIYLAFFVTIITCVILVITTGVLMIRLSKQLESSEHVKYAKEKKWFYILLKIMAVMIVTLSITLFAINADFDEKVLITSDIIKLFSAIVMFNILVMRDEARTLIVRKFLPNIAFEDTEVTESTNAV